MLATVLGTPGAIGIAGLQTADPWRDRVRLIAIDGGDGCIIPSAASVSDGDYPLSRDLLLYISGDAEGRDGEATIAFGDLVSSPGFLERVGQGLSSADIAATTRSGGAPASLTANSMKTRSGRWAITSCPTRKSSRRTTISTTKSSPSACAS
jgi:hypothetical protein